MTLSLLLYCRCGFESDCAREIVHLAQDKGYSGFVKAKENSAYVLFYTHENDDVISFWNDLKLSDLVFARQILLASDLVKNLPEKGRTTPIMQVLNKSFSEILKDKNVFSELFVETPDTNEQKEVLTFCKKFTSPMLSELRKSGYIIGDKETKALRLHIMFLNGQTCFVALCSVKRASLWFMGIPRLKLPKDSPSRSTLKLEEAFLTFLSESERENELKAGMTALDLGASPGGWTYQFVKRNIYVTCIDNGEMDKKLMQSGLIDHIRADGFKFKPQKPLDWIICDMVEKPSLVTKLLLKHALERNSKNFIFNLKLPMKKKFQEVFMCLEYIKNTLNNEKIGHSLKCKNLYHDRDEVTVYLAIY